MKFYHTDKAPKAVGPYSQAVSSGPWLYTAGQVGFNPKTMKLRKGFDAQARQVLRNLAAVLKSAGCTFQDVIKTTIYVTDLGNFSTLNTIYGKTMGDHRPARSTVEVKALPAGALVEIDMIAVLSEAS